MNTKLIEEFKKQHAECTELLNSTSADARSVMTEIQSDYHNSVVENIPKDFGDFLYNALGTKINSQRKVTLNTEYCNAKGYYEQAKNNNRTIDEHLKYTATHYYGGYGYNNSKEQNFSYITTGKRFGFSYYTDTGKLYTKFIGGRQLFYFLTQEHVDLISNKLKRKCAQEFLNFRNNYIAKLAEVGKSLIDTDIPIRMATISQITFRNKFSKSGYGGDDTKYNMVENIADSKIHNVAIDLPTVECWDKTSKPSKNTFEYGRDNGTSVSLYALRRIKKNKKYELCGDFIYTYDSITGGVLGADKSNRVSTTSPSDVYDVLTNFGIKSDASYNQDVVTYNDKLTLDWDKILSDDSVKQKLDDICKFYNTASKAIATLKQRHAGLIFINGTF